MTQAEPFAETNASSVWMASRPIGPETARLTRGLLERVFSELGCAEGWVHFVDDGGNELRLVAACGVSEETTQSELLLAKDAPFVECAAARALRPTTVRADRAEAGLSRSLAALARTHGAALVSLPLVSGDELVGVVTCASSEALMPPRIEALLRLVEPFASGLASARALERERVRYALLERLRTAMLDIARAATLQTALRVIVDEARTLVGARYGALGFAPDPEAPGPFDPWVPSGMTPAEIAAIGRRPWPVGLLGAVARERRVLRIRDVNLDAKYVGVPPHHPAMTSFLGVPIPAEARTDANLFLADKLNGDGFTPDDEQAVLLLAEHAGCVIDRFSAIDRIERDARYGVHARRALTAHLLTARVLAQAPPVETAGRRVLQALGDALGWDWGCLWLLDTSANLLRCAATWRRESLSVPEFEATTQAMTFPPRIGLPGRVWASAKPEWLNDVIDDTRFLRLGVAARAGLHAALFVAVTADGAFLGIMEFMSREERAIDEDHLAMVVASAAHVGHLITRRRAEDDRGRLLASLAVERCWLRAVVERSPVAILLALGRDSSRVMANRRAIEMIGFELIPDQGLGQLTGRLIAIDGRPLSEAELPVRRALDTGEVFSGVELLWRSPSGDRALLVNAAPVDDGSGQRLGAAMVFEDISSIRELRRLRDEWTSMIAHDLRQPVNAISTAAQIIVRGGADARTHALAERILSGAVRLDRMIADLLDASRIDARRMSLEREETDIAALLEGVIERTTSLTTGHTVTREIRGELPKVTLDPARIEQVLCNLLSNAAKYGHDQGRIAIVAERVEDDVRISVLNEGPYVSREDLESFFARFRRGAGRLSGTGLGLYISRGLIEAHGGRIWAEPDRSGWIAFRFTLPLAPPN